MNNNNITATVINSELRDNCPICNKYISHCLYESLSDLTFGVDGEWNLKQCPDCQHIWVSTPPMDQDIIKLYSKYYTHSQLKDNFLRRALKRGLPAALYKLKKTKISEYFPGVFLSKIGLFKEFAFSLTMGLGNRKPGKILDIGCGSGEFLKLMNYFDWDVYGVEIDEEALSVAKKNINSGTFYNGEFDSVELPDNYFDCISMSHVIEHIKEPYPVLNSIYKKLKKGGTISIATPSILSLGHSIFKQDWRGLEVPRHLNIYSSKSLKKALVDCNFEIIEQKTVCSIAYFIWTASENIKNSRKGRDVNFISSLRFKVYGLFFWIYEYIKNKKIPCGEEIIIIARKK